MSAHSELQRLAAIVEGPSISGPEFFMRWHLVLLFWSSIFSAPGRTQDTSAAECGSYGTDDSINLVDGSDEEAQLSQSDRAISLEK